MHNVVMKGYLQLHYLYTSFVLIVINFVDHINVKYCRCIEGLFNLLEKCGSPWDV